MKQNWTYKKLGEVCDVSAGQGAPQGEKNYCTNGTPFVKAGNIEDLINGLDENCIQKVNEDVAKSYKLKLYKAGSVVFAKSGMSSMKGLVYTLKHDCYVVSHLAILTPKEIESSFLNHVLNHFKPNTLIKDEAYPSISLSDISQFTIPVPPLPEQHRIVSELNLLQSIIDKQQAQLKELDTLAQSVFYDMFGDPVENEKGWEVKKMEEVCSKITDGTHDTPQRLDKGVKFITGKHIRPYYIDYDNSDYVDEEVHKEIYMRCNPEYGDVLYTNIGAGVGNAAINIVNYEFSMKNVALLKPHKSIVNGCYIEYFLNNERMKSNIIETFSNGGAQVFLSLKSISKIPIVLPPLSLQQSFSSKIESIEKQKATIAQSIAETQKLFDYTMDKYFN